MSIELTFIIIYMNNNNNNNGGQPNPIGNFFGAQYSSQEFKTEFKEKSKKLFEFMPLFVR